MNHHVSSRFQERRRRVAGEILLILLPALLRCQQLDKPSIVLRERVRLDHDTILLSDLLPAGVADALRTETASVELGRAPQTGSTRVLRRDQICRRLHSRALAQQISIPEQMTVSRTSWPIADESIRALLARYLQTSKWGLPAAPPDDLQRDASFSAAQPSPALQVAAATWNRSASTIEFRIRCVERGICAPFLVRMAIPEDSSGSPARLRRRETAPVLVKAGAAATLRAESGGVRVSVRVLPLQPGTLGEIVRVRDPFTNRVFRVRVTGAEAVGPVLQ